MRPTRLIVDINKFKSNVEKIKNYCANKKIMPVLKARAYGTDIDMIKDITNAFDIVAVAMVDEALALRNFGYENEVFILNQPYEEDIEDILNYNITIGISELSFIKTLCNTNKEVKVHLEIETGMNRTGIKLDDLNDYCKLIKEHKNIIVEGIYTHFANADFDEEYTKNQIDTFNKALEIAKQYFDNIKYIHTDASSGILKYLNDTTNLVRPGILLYGYEPFENAQNIIPVQPVCKLETKVIFLKEVKKGEKISYGSTYEAESKRIIATIPIGYADGIRRELSNNGFVVVNDKKAPIVGTICMDSMMIDVTDIPNVNIGTNVYIWDNNIITLDEIAKKCGTINYEILSTISYRVKRYFNFRSLSRAPKRSIQMKKLISALIADPICNAIMSILTYAFYGVVIGLSMAPSALFLFKMSKIIPVINFLNAFLFALCIGVSVYMFFVVSLIVFGIFERILTIGFKPGRYSTDSFLFARWIIYSGLHVILMNMVMPYVSGTVWARLFYKILGAKIGKNVFINTHKISDGYLLELGDNVVIGGDASVSCHIFEGNKLILGKIKIGNNSLVGAETYIMPGVTIGNDCSIGLNTFIRKNKNIPDKSIIMGVPGAPAKQIAELLKEK